MQKNEKNIKKIIFFIFIFFQMNLFGNQRNQKKRSEHDIGELSFLQLPGPLFSFGQNIIKKSSAYISSIVYQLKGQFIEETTLFFPRILYGLRDDLSIQISFPTAIKFKEFNNQSSGFENIRITLEYQFFESKLDGEMFRVTVLGSLFLPNGDSIKDPPIGFGSPSVFGGLTFAYFSHDWYLYSADFVHLTTNRNCTKFGNEFFYTAGIGKNFDFAPGLLVSVLLEFLGVFSQRDTICGRIDCNSGGNTIFLGPTLYIASEKLFAQGGIVFPVLQKLNGVQPTSSFFWGVYAGFKI